MAKRIACFVGQITQDYQSELTCSIIKTAEKFGFSVEIFSEFGSFGDNHLYAEGEKTIINLPYLEDYAGVILALDSFHNDEMSEALVQKVKKEAKCPVISVRQANNDFYNIIIDDYSAMAMMVEHFINVHGFSHICFMAGRMDNKDARDRLYGYRETMKKYQLPVEESMIFYGDFWRYKGEAAVECFLSGEKMPEAIICANDYMALSVIAALRKRGIRVPEDVAVSGFDDVDEARYATPRLATMRVPSEKMGEEAVKLLARLLKGEEVEQNHYVSVNCNFVGTCGCVNHEERQSLVEMHGSNQYLRFALMQTSYMNVDLEGCNTVKELLDVAYRYSFNFAYTNMYICLCEEYLNGEKLFFTNQYSDSIYIKAIFSRDMGMSMPDEHFKRREILPQKYREQGDELFLFPLHYKNHGIGYLVLQTEYPAQLKDFFPIWVMQISNYLDKVSVYEENQSLLEFRKLSMMDDLTGLYNRRMLGQKLHEHMMERQYNSDFFIISMDMDGLKHINDTYGHLEGDAALCAFADILKKEQSEHVMCARTGGDEFTVYVATDAEEKVKKIIKRIRQGIDAYNEMFPKEYLLSASVGYAMYTGDDDISECLHRADENMYTDKLRKKNQKIIKK